jgi:G3E family GTPase
MDSFENLLRIADRRGVRYDRIVLENSGVAEPQNIRDLFNDSIAMGHPLTSLIHLDSLVTVVDSATFIQDYSSRASLAARPDLGEGGGLRPVVDLLVEQIECADFVVLNKGDMLDAPTMDSLKAIVGSLNPLARVVACEHGQVPVESLFGAHAGPGLVARLNTEGHHRGAVAAARAAALDEARSQDAGGEEKAHKHHQHDHDHHDEDHKHDHDHADEADGKDKGADCKICTGRDHAAEGGHHHEQHHHEHHQHGEETHEHGDGHDHHHDHDDKHSHHSHKRPRQATTAAARFGILSFVYSRRRPFHPQRLKELVIRWMPVSHNRALDGTSPAPANEDSPIRTVLRSKGFVWLSHAHCTALYWSHAGQHFELRDEGEWWAAVPEEEWPTVAAQRATVLTDFDKQGPYGDRRQEIVFIGANMDEAAICAQLDSALLTDEEMEAYKKQCALQPDPMHPDAPAAMQQKK